MPPAPPTDPTNPARLPQLDSLRGLAALTVVLHHFALMWPAWLDTIDGPAFHHLRLGLLYPLYAGHEAVMLFFVLSGLVLTLPYLHGRAQPYPIYLARRIFRIYFPYLAALALSILGAAYLHGPHTGWAQPFWSQPASLPLVLQHIAFLGVYDSDQYNFVIWSLIFELRISILFPLLCTRTLRRGPFVAIPLFLLISFASAGLIGSASAHTTTYSDFMTFHYMAFFVLGILLAANLTAIRAWYARLTRPARVTLTLLSFALYNLSGRISDHFASLSIRVLGDWGVVLGAIGFIILALNSPVARRILTAAIPTFLGRISYSLYLLHAPILLALTFAIHGRLTPWAQFPIYLAASLAAATIFNRAVEEPFIVLGRRLGRGPRRESRDTLAAT